MSVIQIHFQEEHVQSHCSILEQQKYSSFMSNSIISFGWWQLASTAWFKLIVIQLGNEIIFYS